MKRGFGKKGELTTQQLVTIIVLIASFVIILFLLYRLNLGQTTNSDVCHNSVLLQAQPHLNAGSVDCTTDYLCISGGDKCTLISQSLETKIDTSKSPAVVKNETFKALADAMSNCWWEFGEGKVDYAANWHARDVVCGVCSIVSFDDKVKKLFPQLSYSEFYNYLKTTPKTASQTYLQYLYASNNINPLPTADYFNFTLIGNIDTNQKYSILTGIDRNIGVGSVNPDKILNVYLIPTSKTSNTRCNEFLTKV